MSLLETYKQIIRRRPVFFALATSLYAILVVGFYLYVTLESRSRWTENRVLELQTELAEREKLLAALAERWEPAGVFVDVDFQIENVTPEQRREVFRLFDYASFAVEKRDFAQAERMYREALSVHDSAAARYYLGRLAYFQGNLGGAEAEWRSAIERDPEGSYPLLRLYLGLALQEQGRQQEALKAIREYVQLSQSRG